MILLECFHWQLLGWKSWTALSFRRTFCQLQTRDPSYQFLYQHQTICSPGPGSYLLRYRCLVGCSLYTFLSLSLFLYLASFEFFCLSICLFVVRTPSSGPENRSRQMMGRVSERIITGDLTFLPFSLSLSHSLSLIHSHTIWHTHTLSLTRTHQAQICISVLSMIPVYFLKAFITSALFNSSYLTSSKLCLSFFCVFITTAQSCGC